MKKVFILIFSLFIFCNLPCFAEIDPLYDLDLPPNVTFQAPNYSKAPKRGVSSEIQKPKEPTILNPEKQFNQKKEKGIKGFFKRLFKKDKVKAEFDTVGGGYVGNLPKIEAEMGYKNKKTIKSNDIKEKAEEYLPEEFQESKIEDPLFLDTILNKQNPSNYIKDMIRVMRFLETFRTVVEKHESVQKFNANVNVLDLHTRRIEKLYKETSDGMSESYWLLVDLTYKAKALGNLKYDANYYSKFSPIQGTPYEEQNLLNEDNKLLIDIDKTIFSIRQLNN